jgi:hypothetical protein
MQKIIGPVANIASRKLAACVRTRCTVIPRDCFYDVRHITAIIGQIHEMQVITTATCTADMRLTTIYSIMFVIDANEQEPISYMITSSKIFIFAVLCVIFRR